MPFLIPLPSRAFIRVGGADAETFLQGLLTVDVRRATPERALYGAMLTAQGKFLHEAFVLRHGSDLLLETAADRAAAFVSRLNLYKLRSQVTVAADASLRAYALYGEGAPESLGLAREGEAKPYGGGVAFADPRHAGLGARLALSPGDAPPRTEEGDAASYHARRIRLGVPDGELDLIPEKSFPMQCNFDDIHAVDFTKGCFVGQEVTARTKHRGGVSRRLAPVRLEGDAPPAGTAIKAGDATVGELRGSSQGVALASFRIEDLEKVKSTGAAMTANGVGIALI